MTMTEDRRARARSPTRSTPRIPRSSSSTCSAISSSPAASAKRSATICRRVAAIVPTVAALIALFRAKAMADPPHAREPQARPLRLPARQAAARQPGAAHRRRRPDGPHPGARRARQCDRRRLRAGARRDRHRQAGQGHVLRDRASATFCRRAASPISSSPASPPRSACRPRCARPTTAATNAC